jgi:hypothetical protein
MGYYDNREPQFDAAAPGPPRWLLLLAGALVGICLVAACGVAVYFWVLPLFAPATPPAPPVIPTALGNGGAETDQADATTTPSASPAASGTATPAPSVAAIAVPRAAAPPRIDGSLNEWPAVPLATSRYPVYNAAAWEGEQDLLAVWWLAWDGTNLYLAARVDDDAHVQTEQGTQIYKGDSVEVQIDTNPQRGARQVNPDTFQLILSPGDFAGRDVGVALFQGAPDGSLPFVAEQGIMLAAKPAGQGYILEAAVPWSELGVTPEAGMTLGVALNANDNDTAGAALQELMLSHVPGRTLRDPTTWGSMTLQ